MKKLYKAETWFYQIVLAHKSSFPQKNHEGGLATLLSILDEFSIKGSRREQVLCCHKLNCVTILIGIRR